MALPFYGKKIAKLKRNLLAQESFQRMPLRNEAYPINNLFVQNMSAQGAQYSYKHKGYPCLGSFSCQRWVDYSLWSFFGDRWFGYVKKLKPTVNIWHKAGKVAALPSRAPGASHALLTGLIHYGSCSSHSNFSQELDSILGFRNKLNLRRQNGGKKRKERRMNMFQW